MAPLWLSVTAFATLATLANAAVEFTSPKAGATLEAGEAIEVEWKDGGDGPALADLTTYELFLCAGGNDPDTYIQLLGITSSGTFAAGNKAQGMVGTGLGANTKNAYFLKIMSTSATGGTMTNFSPRFSYSGMVGTFPAPIVEALKKVTGTDGPSAVDATVKDPADVVNGDYDVEYAMQTGLTRYAPMQPVPPTKITKKTATPLHPTSSVAIATTNLPIPKQQTTITQSQTHKVSSRENTVAAAPHATDDMAKFLNRWKD